MTQRDAVDDVIDRFGAQLEQAERRADLQQRPRRVRRLMLAGAGLAVAGTLAVLVLGTIGGGSKLDVVSAAQAALAPEGRILHMKIAYGRPGEPDDPKSKYVRETWSATNPNRWKYVQTDQYVRWSRGKAHPTGQTMTEEFAFAGGTMSDYHLRTNRMTTVSGYPESGPQAAPLTWAGMPPGQDPASALRSLLASGRLTSAGTATLSGRSVLRLRGTSPEQMERGIPELPVEYNVDARTFVPVRMLVTQPRSEDVPNDRPRTSVIWFRAFERLPLTRENEALLTVHPAADTKITRYRLQGGRACRVESKPGKCLD